MGRGRITLTLHTELKLEVETEDDLKMVLKNMPWLKARPIGFVTEHASNQEMTSEMGMSPAAREIISSRLTLPGSRMDADKKVVLKALERSKTISEAAEILGITRATLYTLIGKYEIEMMSIHAGCTVKNKNESKKKGA